MSFERKSILQRQLDNANLKANKDIELVNGSLSRYDVEKPNGMLANTYERIAEFGPGKSVASAIAEQRVFNTILTKKPNVELINTNMSVQLGNKSVRVPLYTKEKVGDTTTYYFEVVADGKEFYKDAKLLQQIRDLTKLSVEESDNSMLNNLNKINDSVGQRASAEQEVALFPSDEPITSNTRLRVWVNKNDYNAVATEVDANGKKKKDLFREKVEEIAKEEQASKPEEDEQDDGEKQKYECTDSDFESKKDFPSNDVIKCRIKYTTRIDPINKTLHKGSPRDDAERIKLKNRLEVTNTLRGDTNVRGLSSLKKGVFGYAIITSLNNQKTKVGPLYIDIKGVSGSTTNFTSFAPTLPPEKDLITEINVPMYPTNPDGRVFTADTLTFPGSNNIETISSYRGHDTEVRILEYLASQYYKKNKQSISIELFTDREACQGCDGLIKRINNGQEQTEYSFTIIPIEQGIYHTSNPIDPNTKLSIGPEKLTEKINKEKTGFYETMNEEEVK